jgi:hypothetical protein
MGRALIRNGILGGASTHLRRSSNFLLVRRYFISLSRFCAYSPIVGLLAPR